MRPTLTTLALTFTLASAALAACGPPPPPANPEPGAPTSPTAPTAAPSAPAASAAPTAAPSVAPTVSPAAGTPNTPVQPSTLAEEARKLGIDFKKVPDLEKIPLPIKKKLMPLFVKSLGYESCTGCHADGDYKKETRNVKVARGMWNHFVKELRDDKGGALFCDSCHVGKTKILHREDKAAVKKFMETDYENKLARADKKENACSTCHGDDMQEKIIEKRWGIAAK